MKKKIIILAITTSIILTGCGEKDSAITDSITFMNDFNRVTTEYKANPTKENLRAVLDLVENSDIKLNDEEKKLVDKGIKEVEAKVSLSNDDIKDIWRNNEDKVLDTINKGKENLIDKIKSFF